MLSRILDLILSKDDWKDVTFEDLTALTDVRWENGLLGDLTTLESNKFDGLSGAISLFLNGNNLQTLPVDIFMGLANINWLNLGTNEIMTLPENILQPLSTASHNLRAIDLRQNNLNLIPANLFANINNLQDLHLQFNNLTSLPDGVFDDLTSLRRLHLQNNQLTTLQENIFNDADEVFASLETFNIASNNLDVVSIHRSFVMASENSIQTFLFDEPTPNGIVLSTSNAQFNIPFTTSNITLNQYTLNKNNVIYNHLLSSSPNLTWQSQNNSVASVNSDGLIEAVGIGSTTIRAHHPTDNSLYSEVTVQVSSANAQGIHTFRSQAVAEIILNTISGVTEWNEVTTTNLESSTSLTLGANTFSSVYSLDFRGLTNLETLSFYQNTLSEIPTGLLDDLSSVTLMSFNGSPVSQIPSGLFDGLDSVERLYIRGNQYTNLPEGIFDELNTLDDLHMDNGALESLNTGVFSGLTDIKRIFLEQNNLSTLPENVFDGLPSLNYVNLQGNSLD